MFFFRFWREFKLLLRQKEKTLLLHRYLFFLRSAQEISFFFIREQQNLPAVLRNTFLVAREERHNGLSTRIGPVLCLVYFRSGTWNM